MRRSLDQWEVQAFFDADTNTFSRTQGNRIIKSHEMKHLGQLLTR